MQQAISRAPADIRSRWLSGCYPRERQEISLHTAHQTMAAALLLAMRWTCVPICQYLQCWSWNPACPVCISSQIAEMAGAFVQVAVGSAASAHRQAGRQGAGARGESSRALADSATRRSGSQQGAFQPAGEALPTTTGGATPLHASMSI